MRRVSQNEMILTEASLHEEGNIMELSQSDQEWISDEVDMFEKTTSTEEILKAIRALPKKERDKLKSDTDELNDYILLNYRDYYQTQVQSVKYTIPGAIQRYMELLADKI